MERTDFEQWKAKEVARLLALVETERRYYQEMVASLPVALVVLSADRSIVSANRAFRQTFGLKTEDMRRKTIEQILPYPALTEKIRDTHVHGPAPSHLFLDRDDQVLRVAIVPMRNWDDESEVETLLLVEDVTTLTKRAPVAGPPAVPAPALDLPAIVWQADSASLVFTSVSGAAERLLGFPAAHWLDTPQFFRDRIHPEDRAATLGFYQAATGDASAEFRAVTASGSVIWCRETIRVAGDRITGVLTDITLRRQLEDQLLTAGRSDALHSVASRLSHDLNNPLMIITGYADEMLQALPPEDPMRDDVKQILGATERISGITAQLLAFTRRIAGEAQPVNVCSLLAGLEEKIAHDAGSAVALEVEVLSESIWALADPEQLEEAILALTSSSREDAKERTRLVISCSVEAISELPGATTLPPGLYACLSIQDNGRGTDAVHREQVFEGIFSSQTIARAHANVRAWGGDIAFSSEPFRGSAFRIYLPYHEPEPAALPVVETPVEPEAAPVPEPAVVEAPLETILVVEDEPGIRALVRKILRREHFGVIEAGSAEEALAMAAAYNGQLHLLLTDVMLPGMGGRELAESLRASAPGLKVLYVSGYTSDEDVRAGAFPPGSKFLQKPFTLSALVGKVKEALAEE